MDIWALLEKEAPAGCDDVQDLYSWSLNYGAGQGPFTLFVDLIGWSEDNYGEPGYSLKGASLGYVELSKLADALAQYVDHPNEVRAYVDRLVAAEFGQADDDDDEPTPDEDDAYVTSDGFRLTVSFGGKHLGTVAEDDEADQLIRDEMERAQFWPNVWTVSDHGNISPRTI